MASSPRALMLFGSSLRRGAILQLVEFEFKKCMYEAWRFGHLTVMFVFPTDLLSDSAAMMQKENKM